jgi:DNA polymerase V
MGNSTGKDNNGRPPLWGELPISRPRLPLGIVAEIDRIREQFTDPEDAHQYILECLTRKPKVRRLKLYDCRISATPGISASGGDNSYEEREVPLLLLKNPAKSFLVRVAGASMVDAGIGDGNFIIAEERNPLFENPPNRAIVTAVVDDQILVKRYRYRQNKHELLSENQSRNYPSISIELDASDHNSIYIFGIFQRVIPESMMNITAL